MAMSVFVSQTSLIRMIESLSTKLTSSAIQQASLHIGVSQHLHECNQTLSSVKVILLDLDSFYYPGLHDDELQPWLKMLKKVFNSVQNMVDEILFHCQALEGKKAAAIHDVKERLLLFTMVFIPIGFRRRPTLASQINDITERLLLFTDKKFHVKTRLLHRKEITYPCVIESDVIGRDIDKEIIIEKLLMQQQQQHEHDVDQRLSVLPIVGMGGLGKTTLAKLVFGDQRICESFSVMAWVCVSNEFDIELVMIKSAVVGTPFPAVKKGKLDMTQLVKYLEKKLVAKKFLLVLDDVWNEDPLKWDELRNLILTGAKGSKILLTTRNHLIASAMTSTIPSHNLEPLSLKDSLSLFEKCAIDEEAKKYPNLIEIGREIVKQCGGIPSAIKEIGSMIFSNNKRGWLDSWTDSELRDLCKEYGILPAFRLSYDYMPFHLKQCFELFALYPNDFVFHSSEVISLWAALDLLPSPNIDENLTDVALRCLRQLMPRSFLRDFVNFGTSFYFQIHDLVHALARDMANYECLMVNSNNQAIPVNVRYLSFAENNLFDNSFTPHYVDVRIVLFPIEGLGATNQDFLNMCLSKYKYLRILDLSDSTYEFLPRSIRKLRHLRFLSLERNDKIKKVSDSVCKLQNLQVFSVAGCIKLEKFPKGLRNLTSLRQLGITTKESTLPENDIANLDSLEILNIDSCDKLESFCVRVKFPALKTLEVANCGRLKYVPLDIDHFPLLDTLLVDNCGYLELTKRHDDQDSTLQLKAISFHSLPQIVNLPCWLQKSTNTLRSLLIVDCKNLEVLPEWLSTMSFLVSIGIVNCPKLKSLPNHIHHLNALEFLRIEGCPELCRKLQPQIGEYWSIISHIKQVIIGKPEDLEETKLSILGTKLSILGTKFMFLDYVCNDFLPIR